MATISDNLKNHLRQIGLMMNLVYVSSFICYPIYLYMAFNMWPPTLALDFKIYGSTIQCVLLAIGLLSSIWGALLYRRLFSNLKFHKRRLPSWRARLRKKYPEELNGDDGNIFLVMNIAHVNYIASLGKLQTCAILGLIAVFISRNTAAFYPFFIVPVVCQCFCRPQIIPFIEREADNILNLPKG